MRAIHVDGSRATADVETGPWLSWDGRTGSVGSLGVLFDNVLAYPMMNGSSASHSLVSQEITIDSVAGIPVDGQVLTARSRLLHRDDQGAFATAELCTPAGQIVAFATQRGRFVPIADAPAYDYQGIEPSSSNSTLADLMWSDGTPPHVSSDGDVAMRISPRMGNHMDNLHGGLSLLLAEWSALAAVRARGSDLRSASVRISYARPLPVGTAVTFETSVHHLGRTTGTVGVVGRTESGKCAVAAGVTLG